MHNFKKIWKPVLVLLICAGLLKGLDLALYPCTFMRNDIHSVCTREYDDIIVGTSHGKMNIDPEAMESVTGRTAHNICVGGEYGVDVYYLVRLITEKQKPGRILYEIDPGYFVTEKEEGNNYLLFYHEFPASRAKWDYFWTSIAKCNFRTVLFPWYEYSLGYELENIKENLSRKLSGDYDISFLKSDTQEYRENGFVDRYPVDTTQLKMTKPKLYEEENISTQNMEYLKKTIAYCREEGIEFVAVTTPIPAATLKQFSANYEAAWSYFDEFFREQGVEYLNFNAKYYKAFSHKMECYTDFDGHMNGDAARGYSEVLAGLLPEMEKPQES